MIDYMWIAENDSQSENSEGQSSEQLMMLSAAPASSDSAAKSMKIMVEIQGHNLSFLIDSGSSSCFIDQHAAQFLSGKKQLSSTVKVQVARGKILHCEKGSLNCSGRRKDIRFVTPSVSLICKTMMVYWDLIGWQTLCYLIGLNSG
jgi:hypothetical protein